MSTGADPITYGVTGVTDERETTGESTDMLLAALHDTRRRLNNIQTLGHIALWEYDVDCGTLAWTDAMFTLCERDRQLGPPTISEDAARYTPDSNERLRACALRVIETGEPSSVELEARLPSGRPAHFAVAMRPVHDATGRVVLLSGTMQDITERKQAEDALAAERNLLRTLIDNIPALVYVKDAQSRLLLGNAALARRRGAASVDELIGRTDYGRVPDDLAQQYYELEQTVMRTGEPAYNVEEPGVDADGNPAWGSTNLSPLRDAQGEVIGLAGVTIDTTEQRAMRDALGRSEALLRQILDTSPAITVVKDAEGRYILASRAAEGFYGVPSETLLGKTDADLAEIGLISHDHAAQRYAAGRAALESGQTVRVPAVAVKRVDGASRWYQVTRTPLCLPGEPSLLLSLIIDVTDLKEAEDRLAQQERVAAVGQLAGGIAHDFNNILTTILLYTETLQYHRELPEQARSTVATIRHEARAAAELVQQILDFSRRSTIQAERLDLRALVARVGEILTRTLPETISLHIVTPERPCEVMADANRIQQAVMNLATNARDAMPQGGDLFISVWRLQLDARDEPPAPDMPAGEWACLSVKDTGPGLSREALDHLFEPFYTTKPPSKGTGLGLPQVYGIVQQHQGYIDVDTEPGRGTAIHIFLPRPHDADAPEAEEAPVKVQAPRMGSAAILVVEDQERIRETLRAVLEDQGYVVLTARDGREALDVHRAAERVDLVLTDLVMPRMGGQEMVRELRRTHPTLRAVAITGYSMEERADSLYADGIIEVVRKPFDIHALCDAVERALGERDSAPLTPES